MQKHIYNLSHAQRKYLGHILNSYPDLQEATRAENEKRTAARCSCGNCA